MNNLKYLNEILEIKASGGIKTNKEAKQFLSLGVTRIGTSNAVDIISEDICDCDDCDDCHCDDCDCK